MELRELKTFHKVATLLSFNLAADALHYAQSTVSAQIKSLEDDLGVELFDRLGKRIVLTEAGENLLNHAQRILAMVEETYASVTARTALEGSLTVRVPQTIVTHYLPKIIMNFQTLHPKVELKFTTCTAYRLVQELGSGAIDLAFLMTESVVSERLHAEILGFEELVWVAHSSHSLVNASTIDFRSLDGQTLLIPKADCDYPLILQKSLVEERVKPAAMPEFNSIEATKRCVGEGLGISLLPRIAVASEVKRGELTILPWADGPLETVVFMIWHREKWLTPTLSAFLQTVRQTVQQVNA